MKSICMHLVFQWVMKTMPPGHYSTSCSPSHVHQYLLLREFNSFPNVYIITRNLPIQPVVWITSNRTSLQDSEKPAEEFVFGLASSHSTIHEECHAHNIQR